MDIINRISRQRTLNQIPDETKQYIDNLSPEERGSLKLQLQSKIGEMQKSQFGSRVGNTLNTAANIFGQMGGIDVGTKPKQQDNINDFILKETLKQKLKTAGIPDQEDLPEGLYRDKVTGKIIKTPATSNTSNFITAEEKQQLQEEKMRLQTEYEKEVLTHKSNLEANDPIKANQNELKASKLQKEIELLDKQLQGIKEVPEGYERGIDKKGNQVILPIDILKQEKLKKLQAETEEKEQANIKKTQFVKETAADSLDTIAEVEKGMDLFGARGVIPAFPDTRKFDWKNSLNKLTSEKVLALINQMKSASKTGATGFGALSERELTVLQNAATELKAGTTRKRATEILADMKEKLQRVISGSGEVGDIGTVKDEKTQAKEILLQKGYSEQEAEQMLGQ